MVVFKVGRNENKICMLYIVMKIRIPRDPQDRGPNRRTRHCLVGGRLLVTIFFLLLQDGLIIGKVFEVIRVDHLDGGAEPAGELEGDRSLTEEVVDGVLVGFIVMIIMGCRVSDDGAHERIGFLGLPDLRPDGGRLGPSVGETKCDIWSGRHPYHVCRDLRCVLAHFVKFERCDFFAPKKSANS